MSQLKSQPNKNEDNYLDNVIYKVKKIKNDKVDTIYVFYGKKEKKEEHLMKQIFTDKEYDDIKEHNTKIVFCEQRINPDDSIATIKIKILNELSNKEVSLEEIYLFCKKIEKLNSVAVYQSLTQNKKISLTKLRLDQFIQNVDTDLDGEPLKEPEEKEVYSYDDIFEMKLDNKEFIINKVLGQKYFIVENEYPFICNPFNVKTFDKFLEHNARKSLSTLNNHLLLNSGKIVDNSIYLCLAEDVLTHVEKNDIPEQTTLKIYYPLIYNKNINSLEELERNREQLIEGNKKYFNQKTIDSFKTINMFYDVYNLRKNELKYVDKGIKYIKAIMKPDFSVKMPLEIIFKILHATEINPFIKYNPSSRQENIYRLYADKISTDGRKIPFLKKGNIFKLMKNIGRSKSVSVYIETKDEQILNCDFDEEGYITMTGEFNKLIDVNAINEIFIKTINPIIQEIKSVLEQSGYKLNLFNSLTDENIEIKQMTYETQITILKAFNIDKFKGCINSVFINETNPFKDKKQNISLRFKRVSNFSKFNSQEAFILEKADQGLKGNIIIHLLLENFPDDLNEQQARELVAKVASELEVERGVRKSDIKIKENPGFKTEISLNLESAILKITTENINNLNYLYTLPIYLDTMVRITQDKNSTKYPVADINKLCGAQEIIDVTFPDISSSTEISLKDGEVANIEGDESVEYEKYDETEKEKFKNAFNLFFDDDESDKSYESTGGQLSSSEESIPSEKDDSSVEMPKYGKVTVPEGISSEESIPSIESLEKKPSPIPILSPIPTPTPTPESESKPTPTPIPTPTPTPTPTPETESTPTPIAKKEYKKEPKSVKIDKNLRKDENKDDDDEEDNEEDNEVSDEEDNEVIRNIDGMKLNKKPHYFQSLIEKKDPILILKEETKEYNSYARTCLSDKRRQPVILTDGQLDKINKEHPGFLREQDVIKYGSDEKHQFNYICPRFWCMKNNTLVDPNDIKMVKGEMVHQPKKGPSCGKVLPKKEKKVKPGYYIYEFNDEAYPGLIPDKHPDGLCLPCCFKNYNTDGRIKAKQKCLDKSKKEEKTEKNKEPVKQDQYILGPEKFPLDEGRWGYLQPEMQTMLHEINADSQVSKTNTNIKENHPCLLRHGVELNNKQSFVAAISDQLFFAKRIIGPDNKLTTQTANILSVKEMRESIVKSISIDSFIKYQNGNLVNDFYDPERKVNIEKYNNTKLYSKIKLDKLEDKSYYTKVVCSFENFINFLQDDDVAIDHTYLWDIISMPNKYLFPNGVNLIIFQLPHDDITNNVQLLCPTNHYSSELFDGRKPTIIFIKEDGYYEPVYSYLTDKNKLTITKEFKEPHLSKSIRALFKELIKPFFELICRPLDSMPNDYKIGKSPNIFIAKRPLLLSNLIQKLNQYEYDVKKLVMNFNNKIIGVVAEDPDISDRNVFIPCYPSSLDENIKTEIDFVFMNDETLWQPYVQTVQFLKKLSNRSKKRRVEPDIPCKPAFKIVEDEMVVGILTNTNQFIQISEPLREDEINEDLDLPSITDQDYIVNPKEKPMIQSDSQIITQNVVDTEREDYIKKIKLETSFYNVFRNTIRILLNNYENIKIREKIEAEMLKEYILYSAKLFNIKNLLQQMVADQIQFIGDKNYYKLINEVSTCIVKDKDKCKSSPNLCVVTENGKCNLILPERNLITNKENETIYFGRMADELIRYNRIKSFMLQPQTYLSFGNIGYNLKDNEIILIQSILTQEYFENLIPAITNKYTKFNSYDETQPVITQTYDNKIDSLVGYDNIICDRKEKDHIVSSTWRSCFPEKYTEIEFTKHIFCTFNFIIEIIERKTKNKYSINEIKNILYNEYKPFIGKYKNNILNILISEGKKTLGDKFKTENETHSFATLIYAENYFLTALDLWLLVNKFEIPTIFISQKNVPQTKYENNGKILYKNQFLAYGEKRDEFVFIVLPGFRPENIPNFKMIKNDKGDIFISLDKLNESCCENIENIFQDKISIENYIADFKMESHKEKKKEKLVVIETDSLENEIKPKNEEIVENEPPEKVDKLIMKDKNKTKKANAKSEKNNKTKKRVETNK